MANNNPNFRKMEDYSFYLAQEQVREHECKYLELCYKHLLATRGKGEAFSWLQSTKAYIVYI